MLEEEEEICWHLAAAAPTATTSILLTHMVEKRARSAGRVLLCVGYAPALSFSLIGPCLLLLALELVVTLFSWPRARDWLVLSSSFKG